MMAAVVTCSGPGRNWCVNTKLEWNARGKKKWNKFKTRLCNMTFIKYLSQMNNWKSCMPSCACPTPEHTLNFLSRICKALQNCLLRRSQKILDQKEKLPQSIIIPAPSIFPSKKKHLTSFVWSLAVLTQTKQFGKFPPFFLQSLFTISQGNRPLVVFMSTVPYSLHQSMERIFLCKIY